MLLLRGDEYEWNINFPFFRSIINANASLAICLWKIKEQKKMKNL